MAAGNKFELRLLTSHSVLVFLSLVWFTFAWALMKGNLLLLAGLVFAILTMMVFWVAALYQHGGPQEFLLLPLPLVAFVSAIWAPVGRRTLDIAWKHKKPQNLWPWFSGFGYVHIVLPDCFCGCCFPYWPSGLARIGCRFSLVMVGVVLSAVVGEPLRQFLIDWARLRPAGGLALPLCWVCPPKTTRPIRARLPLSCRRRRW